MTFVHAVAIILSSVGAAIVVLWSLRSGLAYSESRQDGVFSEVSGPCVFLFDKTELVDATDGARELLSCGPIDGDDWARFMSFAVSRFPGVEEKLARLADLGRVHIVAATRHPMTMRAEWLGGLSRIVLVQPGSGEEELPADSFSQHAMEEEIDILRGTVDRAPFPAWREDATGTVSWANRAYLDLSIRMKPGGDVVPWPLPYLFPRLSWDGKKTMEQQRVALKVPGEQDQRWFEVQRFPHGGDRVYYALPANAAVQAETALRSFVQTLTKAFAHLTIGLAIFDRKRQLALFNPALIELTGLPPDFLSSRPTLFRVLDAMRERQMLPEPEDYKSWRSEIAALEQAAASGQHEETWTLPNGQTYRVTGRPHLDGAVAFVIEDISAEMSLTRRFRADIEVSHAVIDTLEEAIAVFSPSGLLVLSNAAYIALWHGDDEGRRDTSIGDAVRSWQRRSAVSPVWSEARAFVLATGERKPWRGEARLSDGRLLACRFVPLPGGASMIGFAGLPSGRRSDIADIPEEARQSA